MFFLHIEAGLGIGSFAHHSFAHSLILLKSNERLWAIRSDRSRQMSDREGIAQVTQRKWATVSESLSSLKTNGRFAQKILAKKISNLVF